MTTQRVREPIQCLCLDCHNGTTWVNTKNGMKRQQCATCAGTGEVTRYVVRIVHVDLRQLATDGEFIVDVKAGAEG